jgi:membrane protease YdiL (CAAX protease family)
MFGCAHLDVIDYARTWHVLRLSVFEHLAGAPSAAIDGQLIARMALLVRGIALPAVGGGVFAWVFYRTRSLWTAIGLHAGLNLWTTVSMERITASRVGADPRDVAQAASLILAVAMVEMRRRRSARHVARTAAPSSI